jgi:hypothetical protein
MLPKKDGKPMAFKCTEEFRRITEACADDAKESLSDYIRKAVEMRNAGSIKQGGKAEGKIPKQKAPDETPKTNPLILEIKEQVKEMEKPQEVNTFFKGGK